MALMNLRFLHLVLAAGVLAVAVIDSTGVYALSDQYETSPEQDPAVLLGDLEYGTGYAVLGPVRGDGFLRIYDVETESGIERVSGDGLLALRLAELRAFAALKKLESEQGLAETLKDAATIPAELLEDAVEEPVETARSAISGVGKMFSRLSKGVGAAVSGQGGSPAELAQTVTGQAEAKRSLALQLGVDPHTRNVELADLLAKMAGVTIEKETPDAAVGPNGAFVLPEALHTVLVESSAQELETRTAEILAANAVGADSINALLKNPHYTATERLSLAMRLDAIASVQGLETAILHAARAESRDIAYFELRRAVLLEEYHRKMSALGQIRDVNGILIAMRRDGLAAVILPLDLFAWNEAAGRTFSAIFEGLASLPFPPLGTDFLMTGDITPTAAERLVSFGWEITANYPMPKDVPVY